MIVRMVTNHPVLGEKKRKTVRKKGAGCSLLSFGGGLVSAKWREGDGELSASLLSGD